jgi:hypothetical protein
VNCGRHRRVDGARRDGVDGDAEGRQLDRHGAGEADDAVLRGDVADAPGHPLQAGDGRDVDDAPGARRRHRRRHRLDATVAAGQVDGDDAFEFLRRLLEERRLLADAGAVDENIDAAEGLMRGRHHGLDARRVGDVDGDRLPASAGGCDLVGDGGGVTDVGGDDGRSLGGKPQRHGAAEAAGAAGDDGDLAFEAHRLSSLRD